MRKDPTKWRLKVAAWKAGTPTSELFNIPHYGDGKDSAIDNTIANEGVLYKLTRDPGNGVESIGSGLTDKKWIDKYKKQGRWTAADNRAAVAEEVGKIRSWLPSVIPGYDALPKDAQDVLVDIGYNIGRGGLSKSKSPKFLAAMLNGDWEEAARQMDWGNNQVGYDGKPLSGLRTRNQWRLLKFLKAMKNVTPPLRVMNTDNGKKMIFSPSFWEDPQTTQLVDITPSKQTVTKLKQPIVRMEQPLLLITATVTLPDTYIYGNNRQSFMPSISELFAPKPLSDYVKEYMRKVLNVPQLPSVHQWAFPHLKIF